MQVLTLDSAAFDQYAAKLAKIVEENSSENFDAIVAVMRGGSFVCDAFCRYFPRNRYSSRYDVKLQRPSSKRKDGTVSMILKRLPIQVLNFLRMAESIILSLNRKIKKPTEPPNIEVPDDLAHILKEKETPKILVIDDAIDSGDTLFAISNTFRKTNKNAIIRIAVMTETTSRPCIRADFSIYRNKTLIRFPWSNDYKKH